MNGWTRVEAGHYRHAETGIEIRRTAAHRDHGYRVGVRWHVWVMFRKSRTLTAAGSTHTLRAAIEWVKDRHSYVEVARARIADAYDEALTEDAERVASVDQCLAQTTEAFTMAPIPCVLPRGHGQAHAWEHQGRRGNFAEEPEALALDAERRFMLALCGAAMAETQRVSRWAAHHAIDIRGHATVEDYVRARVADHIEALAMDAER